MEKVRYAVVGAGWIAQEAFMPAVAQTGNSAMTAIVSGNAAAAARLADFYGIEHVFGYDRYGEALASGLFDAVYIALPNSLHADYCIRASEAGIHALVEKPLAVSVAECEAIVDAARRHGTRVMTAYRLHCEPVTVEVIRLVRDGAIGEPRVFSSVFGQAIAAGDHRLRAEHWGGPLQDLGVYCLNAARHVLGEEPVEASAVSMRGVDARFTEVDETVQATLRFASGAIASFTASFNTQDSDWYRVIGTEGEIVVAPGYHPFTPPRLVLRRADRVDKPDFPDIDHFGAQTAYFSDCILAGVEPEPDAAEGLADVRALRAIEAAAASGQPQPIDSPPRPRHPAEDMVRHIERTERRLVLTR